MAVRGVITAVDENSVGRISRRRFNKNISALKDRLHVEVIVGETENK